MSEPAEIFEEESGAASGISVAEYYRREWTRRNFSSDSVQERAVERLQELYEELLEFKSARRTALHKLISRAQPPRGLYLWGGVGRGKSFLMDSFYDCVPYKRKVRIHFHRFMLNVHAEMATLKHEVDPLVAVAERIAAKYRLICFDEFHVSDIADAMILGRLLKNLFELGTVFVMTSNYAPDKLYPNGLKRDNFLPAIKLLTENLDVRNVDNGIDYRLRALEQMQVYHTPAGAAADIQLTAEFETLAEASDDPPEIEIEGRILLAKRCAGGVVWFDCATLCDGPRGSADYLEIARRYHTVLLSDVPQMSSDLRDIARRFTWLVDIFYDHHVNLIMSAAAPLEALFRQGDAGNQYERTVATEFGRTLSRLQEMQSREYLMSRSEERNLGWLTNL